MFMLTERSLTGRCNKEFVFFASSTHSFAPVGFYSYSDMPVLSSLVNTLIYGNSLSRLGQISLEAQLLSRTPLKAQILHPKRIAGIGKVNKESQQYMRQRFSSGRCQNESVRFETRDLSYC